MELDEIKISKAIISAYTDKLTESLNTDVIIAGAGPSGMCCGYYLAKKGKKVAIFERKLAVGGGMWAGGVMFGEIVIQQKAKEILDEFDIKYRVYEKGYYLADSIEAVSAICSKTVKAGAKIFNLLSVEDVMVRDRCVAGVVLNWTAVELANLHVDPITARAKFVVDATGHVAEVTHLIEKKSGIKLRTKTTKIIGEKSMWAEIAEREILKNSKEVCRGLYVCGMAANTVSGGFRMGPIFGGMLLSGKKVAESILKRLGK